MKAPNPFCRDGGTEPGISAKSAQNQSRKVEKNETTDTKLKAPNPFRRDGGTEPGISAKSAQNQSRKVEKNETTDTDERTRYAKTGARNMGSQQSQRKTNLAKLRKTKLLTQK